MDSNFKTDRDFRKSTSRSVSTLNGVVVSTSLFRRKNFGFLRSASLPFTMAKASSSLFQTLKRYFKKPWEITGPCADPEYRLAVPSALEYRVFCPATTKEKAIVPTSNPETVFDIKYYTRDQRRNRPPIRRTILKKPDVEKMMKETRFDPADFPKVYLTAAIEEDINARGGGYQK
ncbi:uncharacterized protein LOC120084028 [Benincasa hispida]|uniref:uncharacterized protein LOC120084028 n=1 Tax=Benincasa hispida TaxID=102211 RepID=UPI0019012765|nr:uncharacterized protein LOC120084028 [Benincasa hispida]